MLSSYDENQLAVSTNLKLTDDRMFSFSFCTSGVYKTKKFLAKGIDYQNDSRANISVYKKIYLYNLFPSQAQKLIRKRLKLIYFLPPK